MKGEALISKIFETPVPLLLAALMVFMIVHTISSMLKKRRIWLLCLPWIMALMAFGCDILVQTDREQIKSQIQALLKSCQNGDCHLLRRLVSPEYQDTIHTGPESLISDAEQGFSRNPIVSIKRLNDAIQQLNPPEATVGLAVMVRFEEGGQIAATYKPVFIVVVRIDLLYSSAKQKWLIKTIEIVEIDKQNTKWKQVSGHW